MSQSSFIFASDASTSERNAHAARNALQAKKRRGSSRFAAKRLTRGGTLPWRLQHSTTDNPSSEPAYSDPDSRDSSAAASVCSTPALEASSLPSEHNLSQWKVVPIQSITTPLGAAQRDPFDTLPLRTNSHTGRLIHHYVNILPNMMFGVESTPTLNTFVRHFKDFALDDALALQVLILVSATQFESLRGAQETANALTQKSRTLALLRQRLKSTRAMTSNGTLWSISSFAAVEQLWTGGNLEQSSLHYEALRHLVKLRGGLQTVSDSSALLQACLVWNFASTSKEILFRGYSPWASQNIDCPSNPPSSTASPLSWDTIFRSNFAYPENTQIFDLTTQLTTLLQILSTAPITPSPTSARIKWSRMLAPETSLHKMFTSPYAGDRPHRRNSDRYKIGFTKTSDLCRLWSLLILSLLLHVRRAFPNLPLALTQLDGKIQSNNPQFNNRFETLAAVLMGAEGHYELFDPKMVWYASVMLSVIKLLSPRNRKRVAQTLIRFLVAFGEGVDGSAMDLPWNEHELRDEVVAALAALSSPALNTSNEP